MKFSLASLCVLRLKKKKVELFDLEPWKHISYLNTINLKLRLATSTDYHSKQANLLKQTQFFSERQTSGGHKQSSVPGCILGGNFLKNYIQHFDVLISKTSMRKSSSE